MNNYLTKSCVWAIALLVFLSGGLVKGNEVSVSKLVDEFGLPSTMRGFSDKKAWTKRFKWVNMKMIFYHSNVFYGQLEDGLDGILYSSYPEKGYEPVSVAVISPDADGTLIWHLPSLALLEIRMYELLDVEYDLVDRQ